MRTISGAHRLCARLISAAPRELCLACALPPVVGAVMVIHRPHRPRLFKQPHPPRPHDSCVCESGGGGGGGGQGTPGTQTRFLMGFIPLSKYLKCCKNTLANFGGGLGVNLTSL